MSMLSSGKSLIGTGLLMCTAIAGPVFAQAVPQIPTPKLVHPGIPLTTSDLSNVRDMIQAHKEPWYSGYQVLLQDPHSSFTYTMRGPFEEVDRNLNGTHKNVNLSQWESDMHAVGNQARLWFYTGDKRYAQKAHDILLAWARTHKVFGGYESALDMGDHIHEFVTGADILRGTWPDWTSNDTNEIKNYFTKVYYPATGLLGNGNQVGPSNKGAYAIVDAVYLSLFNDDEASYDIAITDLLQAGPSGMLNTLSSGQVGESLRDSGHPYDEWYCFARLAEASWSQGIDLYTFDANRLLAVGEYHARLGASPAKSYAAPWIPYGTTDYYYTQLFTNPPYGRTQIRAGVNLLRGAYKVRMGMSTPWLDAATQYAAEDQDDISFSFEKVADSSKATPVGYSYPTTKAISIGLANVDIGDAVNAPGSGTYKSGKWLVAGAGSTIFVDLKASQSHMDDAHFAYTQIKGDGSFIAKVDTPPAGGGNAVAGIAVRDTLQGIPAVNGAIGLSSNQGNQVYAQAILHGWNAMRGGVNFQSHYYNGRCINSCTQLPASAITKGYWFKIDRLGHWLNLSISPDGTSWATIDAGYYEQLPATMYYGLIASSGVSGERISASFSSVAATNGDGLGIVQVPAAPLNTVTGIAGQQASIHWLSSAGAATYNVKRSMSPQGPFTVIASDITGTSYVDSSMVRHGTYYYAVSAVNSAGESGNSPADSAQY